MKKIVKIIFIIMVIICLFGFLYQVRADNFSTSDFENKGRTEVDTAVKTFTKATIGIARVVAVGVAVIMLLIISIKYMTSAPSGRADIKKHAIAYAVGAILLFGTSGILTMLYNISKNIKQ